MSAAPTVAFQIFGCRLNQAEAAEWQATLVAYGCTLTAVRERADVLCVHSCAVTESAVHEVVKLLRVMRRKSPQTRIILSGCATALVPDTLVDLAIPHAEKTQWATKVLKYLRLTTPCETVAPLRLKTRASMIVQDGCDRFCAYCIVPHLRGAPTSVPLRVLLQQAERLFAEGYREIVLTGCHLALYRDPETGADFLALLRALCEVRGEGRFRMGSLEPCVLDDFALIRLLASAPERLCAFLHLPIQTASDALLKRMGRTYTQADVRRLLDAVVEELPTCGLGADWIVGLPGETEADAAATRQLVEDYPFLGAHIFPYSRRPGTPAADFPDQVAPDLLKARVDALTAVARTVKQRTLQSFLGVPMTVIPERQRAGVWEGWSEQRIRCRLPGGVQRGEWVHFTPTLLQGETLA